MVHTNVVVRADLRIVLGRLRGELTGSRCQRLRWDLAGPFAPANPLKAASQWVPRLPRPGPQELGVRASIQMREEEPFRWARRALQAAG
jgi:hypothetical protein